MNKILIYKSNENTCITHFTMNASDSAIRQEADKILEFGQCFRIADISELPGDRVFRNAWEIDDSDLNDGIAGEFTAESNLSILTKSKSLQEEELNNKKQRLSDLPAVISSIEPEIPEGGDEEKNTELEDLKVELENLPSIISGLESSIEKISEDILDTEAKINQLLEILPLDQRRSSND